MMGAAAANAREVCHASAKRKPFRPVVAPGEMRGRDAEVLGYFKAFVEKFGRMPTVKEMCADMPIKRGQLYRNLERLTLAGILKMNPVGTIRASIVARETT